MDKIKTWEERMSTSGRRKCEALAVELMQVEIAEYRALAARATPAQPVGYVLFTGHGDKFSREKPKCEIDYWKPVYLESSRPSPSSVGAAIRALPLPEDTYLGGDEAYGDVVRGYTADQARALLSEAAALAEQVQGQRDTERMSLLQAETVDTIYLDDGRIIDVGGKHAGNLRDAIDAFAAPSIPQDGQKSEGAG